MNGQDKFSGQPHHHNPKVQLSKLTTLSFGLSVKITEQKLIYKPTWPRWLPRKVSMCNVFLCL